MDIMFVSNFLSSLACHSNECLSWMIIVINILTVSYLVFCSFFRFGKTLKVLGFIWILLALAGITYIMILHTCIFTIICAVFTILILITAFAVILTHQSEAKSNHKKDYGSYVINPTNSGKYTFAFYDNRKRLVLQSNYTLETLEEINSAINLCRDRGLVAKFEDHTSVWFEEKGFPKFELRKVDNFYVYIFRCNSKTKVFQSKKYCHYKACLKDLQKMIKIIKSSRVYYSTSIVSDEGKKALVSQYLKPLQ